MENIIINIIIFLYFLKTTRNYFPDRYISHFILPLVYVTVYSVEKIKRKKKRRDLIFRSSRFVVESLPELDFDEEQ